MGGAIDLFSGSTSITGTNLFKVDKSPLDMLDEGIEDVIGQQGQGGAQSFIDFIETLVQGILGFGPDQATSLKNVVDFFDNVLTFLGGLNPLDPNFLENIWGDATGFVGYAENFIIGILSPTNLLSMLVDLSEVGLGFGSPVTGFIPLANLALEEIAAGIGEFIGSVEQLIDAILASIGLGAGVGTVQDIEKYFNDFLALFGIDINSPQSSLPGFPGVVFDAISTVENFIVEMLHPSNYFTNLMQMLGLPDFTLGSFDPLSAVITFINDMLLTALNPDDPLGLAHLLAPLVPDWMAGPGGFGSIGHVPIDNLPTQWIDQALAWGTSVSEDMQSLIDTIVHGIVNPPTGWLTPPSGIDLGGLQQYMSALSKYLGFFDPLFQPIGAQRPPDSIGAIALSHDDHLKGISASQPVYAGVDQSADPVFDFSTLTGTDVPTVPVVAGTTVIGMIGTPSVANKQSVEWYGGNTTDLTALYINLYAVDPTPADAVPPGTGVTTWLHSSDNRLGKLRDLSGTEKDIIDERLTTGMAWNYYNFPDGSIQTVTLGLPTQLPGAGSFTLTFNGSTTTPLVFDTVANAWPTAVWVQSALEAPPTIGAGNVLVYGNPRLEPDPATGKNKWVYGAPGGPYVVCFKGTRANQVQNQIVINPTLPPGAQPKVYMGLLTGQGAYYGVEMLVVGGGRYDIAGTQHAALPHHVAFPSHFGARRVSTQQPPPATIVPDYNTTAVPWFGLCGLPGVTQHQPILVTFTQNGTFDPKLYAWAAYFDVAVCGGGGGGCAGFPLAGGAGGQAAGWGGGVVAKAQAGTTPWSINIGSGGLGGKVMGTVGNNGYGSSVSIPGHAPISATYGLGGTGNSHDLLNGAPGQSASNFKLTDAYGNDQIYYGGSGGTSPNANGSPPGGGGAGGNATALLHDQFGGNGGPGIVYIWAYM